MTAPARTAALDALRAIEAGRVDLPSALAAARRRLTDERDRALASDIVTGTLRWQRTADHLAEHFARRPLSNLDPDVLLILRMSIYQLLHLDRVPASAVVDDAVNLARYVRKGAAARFVNAVLRQLLRQQHRLPLPGRPSSGNPDDERRHLGVAFSHPDWLVARWLDRYGFDAAERWVQFDNVAPRLTLRANTLRTSREALAESLAGDGIVTEPTPYAPDGLVVLEGNPLRARQDGSFYVQDESSQLVALAVGAQPGERVLDLCASPGGKTLVMASAMHDRGLLVACDVRPRRVRLLQDTVTASGAACVRIVHLEAAGPLPFRGRFDRVLVDAPCSGLGTIRRDPDIRWRRSEADLSTFAAAQQMLLHRASEAVRPGGRLVYATCSSEPEENDAVVEAFLAGHPAFALVDLRPEAGAMAPVLDARGFLRTLPHVHRLEAFFAAALVRTA